VIFASYVPYFGVKERTMNASKPERASANLISWGWINPNHQSNDAVIPTPVAPIAPPKPKINLLQPVRHWLDQITIGNAEFARFVCQLIPSQCPFERDVRFLGRSLFHIPPLCKLNPVYDEVVALRFRALCYLADVCGEDVTPYC
jgi:Mo-dependent nitrogenase C-terminus